MGSLLFDGVPAPDCLPALLDNIKEGTSKWDKLSGTHNIIAIRDETLYIQADALGASRIYVNEREDIWSNSFLAVCEIAQPKHFDKQACFEYMVAGSVFGNKSLVKGIDSLPTNSILSITDEGVQTHQRPSPVKNDALDKFATLDAIADFHIQQLERVFEPLARHYADRIRLSFSGGFDSRLMLANLLRFGAKPTLFVYGGEDDEDVRIARTISQAEGLSLECINKGATPAPDPEAFIEETEKNLFAFDGWKVETPLFDFGEDREDRLKRHLDGQIPLNGSLGEIYRNFFYMPDRPSSTGAVVSTFYSQYDPKGLHATLR